MPMWSNDGKMTVKQKLFVLFVLRFLPLFIFLFAYFASLPASFLVLFHSQSFFESLKLSLLFIIVDDFQLDLACRFRFIHNSILANECSCHCFLLLIYI